ncbi:unnamed protein product [Brachionus calyciflorus]|uniref:RNA helicase n=1 Tax=Brachionus calyciflorus TaxID=104777 RepID=A0A813WTQ4_9BILA|nr:unnamed protein product [Brachionus calyciflorus]
MDENWDDDFSTPSVTATETKPTDENNNESEPKKMGFGRSRPAENLDNSSEKKPFGRGRPGEGGNRSGFGFGNKSNDNNEDENKKGFGNRDNNNENGEKRGFGSFRRNDDSGEGGERKSFGGFRRNDGENGERKPFNRRNNENSEDGEKKPFGGGFNRRNNNNEGDNEGGEKRGFRKFGNDDNGERRSFNRRDNNDSEGGEKRGFRKFGNDENGERRTFNRRDNNDSEGGEKKPFGGGFNRRNNEDNEGGEKRGFNRRDNNDGEGGKGFGRGFNRQNDSEGGERKGFNRNRDNDESGEKRSFNRNNENGERKFNRDKSSGDGEGRSFRRDGENSERRGPKKEGEGESEAPKRERYIPEDTEETEASLFSTIAVGVNFKKQVEIKTTLSGNRNEEIKPLTSFSDAKFSELLMGNITKSKYEIPTAVQKNAIPIILARRDLMACAQTGSGKTAAFVLPIMKNILEDGIESSQLSSMQEPQALILSPTRELALQIFHECKKFSHDSIIKTGILYGGVDTGYQLRKLDQGCNILVATPGRLLDVLEKKKISLEKVKYFVLDEADRMLDMGFEKAVREILEKGQVHKKGDRCTFMFSATFPNEIQQLAQDFLHDYLFLAVGEVGGANTDVEQTIFKVTKFEKRNKCIEMIDEIGNEKTMIFVEHKKNADVLGFFLIQKGYPATTIHGDRLQSQREAALNEFKNGKANIIVCTAVAARGLDIEKVNHVINYDLPSSIDEYVHRIGRTGRCGNLGKAISFFDPETENDRKLARPLVRIFTQAQQQVPEWLNSFAEDSVGTAFTGNSCSTDLRSKFKSLSVEAKSAPTPAANTATTTSGNGEEESWD